MNIIKFIVEIISSTITSVFLVGLPIVVSMLLLVFVSLFLKQDALRFYYELIPASYHKTIVNVKTLRDVKKFISTEKEKAKYNLIIEKDYEQ